MDENIYAVGKRYYYSVSVSSSSNKIVRVIAVVIVVIPQLPPLVAAIVV